MQSQERLNGLNHGGPRQRAEALAALNSAFSSSSTTKKVTPRPSVKGQGSQRAAAVAALSSVLTAEKKKQSPDTSPVASDSPVPESSISGNNCSFFYRSRMLKFQPLVHILFVAKKIYNGFLMFLFLTVCKSFLSNIIYVKCLIIITSV